MTDAVVVGSGPNGLAAAVVLARAGLRVDLYEAKQTAGGGTRTEELIFPGHWHDICSAVHPMAFASPFFQQFGIRERLEWFVPELSYAHPLDGGIAGLAYRDLERTVDSLGADGPAYRRLMKPLIKHTDAILAAALNSMSPQRLAQVGPIALAGAALWQGTGLWNLGFRGPVAPALITGVAAHPVGPMPTLASSLAGLLLAHLGHTQGWPIPQGGSAQIAAAMLTDFQAHGGQLHTGQQITDLAEVAGAKAVLLDTSAKALLSIAGHRLPARYISTLDKFSYNNAACKVDFILSEPVPWRNPEIAQTATVHLGGTRAEIAQAEAEVARNQHPERPYVLISQPSQFDATRAPSGRHILWSYCHVPRYSTMDMTEAITAQIERFAPGFRDTIVASKVTTAMQLSEYNPNYIGGDFGSGTTGLRQVLARPVIGSKPWKTPLDGLYLCSSSTAPGPGVHGMSGFNAAKLALKEVFRIETPELAPSRMEKRC
ncbi:phytoene desaturase family protein [Psychromicrobium sp. YIM B11713]|uniref:phytoene desaturase family protein n=1 Tax=Psychromicrobium sp. YIM B11713 TaxID=3145233 RepID=UPI00374EEE73